ncbi:MAG: ribosomal protein S18 acetylase RimI-like enzyme [Oceanicoccus sp.]|jgi:ribosomal protein S18 acetylase RimI-like enzyme
MNIPKVKTATLEEKEKCIDILKLAFSSDPFMRWMLPEATRYLKHFDAMCMVIGGGAFEAGTAHYIEDQSGAALWLPPGVENDEEASGIFLGSIDFSEEMLENIGKLMEEIEKYHPHDDPCWYLGLLGADCARQNEGRGSLLMKEVLPRCDADGVLAYLESSNPQNVPFYERHGFEVMGEIWVGQPQAFTPMIREPR